MPHPTQPPATPAARTKMSSFHADVVREVEQAIAAHDVVVVGMAWNPHVPKSRATLDAAGIAHHDLDYGNYLTGWKKRLAIKLWSGWPTFPQVYVKGTLIGGASDVHKAIEDGSLRSLLDAPSASA